MTATPRSVAASTSITSTPTPVRSTTLSRPIASMTRRGTGGVDDDQPVRVAGHLDERVVAIRLFYHDLAGACLLQLYPFGIKQVSGVYSYPVYSEPEVRHCPSLKSVSGRAVFYWRPRSSVKRPFFTLGPRGLRLWSKRAAVETSLSSTLGFDPRRSTCQR